MDSLTDTNASSVTRLANRGKITGLLMCTIHTDLQNSFSNNRFTYRTSVLVRCVSNKPQLQIFEKVL